jgi:hypothetical protein
MNIIHIKIYIFFYLFSDDFTDAIFGTVFNGNFNMSCAAWNGTSQFRNNGKKFLGTFMITGTMTDWEVASV